MINYTKVAVYNDITSFCRCGGPEMITFFVDMCAFLNDMVQFTMFTLHMHYLRYVLCDACVKSAKF